MDSPKAPGFLKPARSLLTARRGAGSEDCHRRGGGASEVGEQIKYTGPLWMVRPVASFKGEILITGRSQNLTLPDKSIKAPLDYASLSDDN